MDSSIQGEDTLGASAAPRPPEAIVSVGFYLRIAAGFIVLMLRFHWLLIGLMFVCLSADEAAEIHEMWRHYLMPYANWTGVLFYRSTVPNLIIATVVGLFLLPFVRTLGRGTQIRLVASAALYVGGAIGVEMLGGAQHEALGTENLRYQLLVASEETLEMFGALGFAAAFLHYLRHWTDRPRLTLSA
jgi:hypothetical protein